MKTQRALRLRQAGKHRLEDSNGKRFEGVIRYGMGRNLARAFEMNCVPKHSDEPPPDHPYITMDYVTGVYTWHGRVTFWPGPQTFNVQDFGSETS